MLRYLIWGLGFTLALMSCKQDLEEASVPVGTSITSSTQFNQDTIFWDLTNQAAGLIIDTEEDLIIDFQGAFIAGKSFGKNPDQHQGTAIKVINAKKLLIKNADFSAFQQGIVADHIDHLVLDNCNFSHFYRSPTAEALLLESSGLNLLKVDTLSLINVDFKHLDRALELAFVKKINIDHSTFSWLRQGVIRVDQAEELTISNSQFIYIGLPGQQTRAFDLPELTLEIRDNYWAHLDQIELENFGRLPKSNQLAYVKSFPEEQWNKSRIDSLLLTFGVTTPALIFLDEWGIYDHTYPKAWFRQKQEASDVFLLTAPPGNWRLVGGTGYDRIIPKTGTFPTTLRAERTMDADSFLLEFEYLGKPTRRFGKPYKPLRTYLFHGVLLAQ